MLIRKFCWKYVIALGITALLIQGCDRLSVKKNLDGEEYSLLDQDSTQVVFPDNFSGKVVLVGYVYTHCPDICPMITYNMQDVQGEIGDKDDFMLVSVSFDPDRDTPKVLSDYAESFELDQQNWRLLTGEKSEVESLLEKLEITRVKSPTRFVEDRPPVYFFDHTDKVSLIDKKGRVRRSYFGSELDSDQVAEDIQTLLKET